MPGMIMIRKLISQPYKRLRLGAGMIRSHKADLARGLAALAIVGGAVFPYLQWRSNEEQRRVDEAQYELNKTQEERKSAQSAINEAENAIDIFRKQVERRKLEGKDVSLDEAALRESVTLLREARTRNTERKYKDAIDISNRIVTMLRQRCPALEPGCESFMVPGRRTQEAY